MTAEPKGQPTQGVVSYRGTPAPGAAVHDTGMDFWTRFYVGAMGGMVACVVASVACFGMLWLAGVLMALLSVPAVVLSRRAKSSGYIAGYWAVAAALTALFLVLAPYLHA
jgi:hypothetical protein